MVEIERLDGIRSQGHTGIARTSVFALHGGRPRSSQERRTSNASTERRMGANAVGAGGGIGARVLAPPICRPAQSMRELDMPPPKWGACGAERTLVLVEDLAEEPRLDPNDMAAPTLSHQRIHFRPRWHVITWDYTGVARATR